MSASTYGKAAPYGTARAALAVDAMSAELDQFVTDIENFEAGRLPRFTSSEFNNLDKRLNDTYQSFMRVPHLDTAFVGTVEKGGVKGPSEHGSPIGMRWLPLARQDTRTCLPSRGRRC